MVVLFTKSSVDQIKQNEMGVVCGTHGGDEKCVQNFSWKVRREETIRKTKV
jgi:hypothetical protein